MSSSEFFSEFGLMRQNLAVLQYDKHPAKYRGIDFNARARSNFLALDGIWRDHSKDVSSLFASCDDVEEEEFNETRLAYLQNGVERELAWSLNRLTYSARGNLAHDASDISGFADPWFRFRMREIERALFLHPRTAGPIKKNARRASSSAFSAMHIALRALEASKHQGELARLSKVALTVPRAS